MCLILDIIFLLKLNVFPNKKRKPETVKLDSENVLKHHKILVALCFIKLIPLDIFSTFDQITFRLYLSLKNLK
jgi:hypothetical protein